MKVICNKADECTFAEGCFHSKPHRKRRDKWTGSFCSTYIGCGKNAEGKFLSARCIKVKEATK